MSSRAAITRLRARPAPHPRLERVELGAGQPHRTERAASLPEAMEVGAATGGRAQAARHRAVVAADLGAVIGVVDLDGVEAGLGQRRRAAGRCFVTPGCANDATPPRRGRLEDADGVGPVRGTNAGWPWPSQQVERLRHRRHMTGPHQRARQPRASDRRSPAATAARSSSASTSTGTPSAASRCADLAHPLDAQARCWLSRNAAERGVVEVDEIAEHVDVAASCTAVISMPGTTRMPCARAKARRLGDRPRRCRDR